MKEVKKSRKPHELKSIIVDLLQLVSTSRRELVSPTHVKDGDCNHEGNRERNVKDRCHHDVFVFSGSNHLHSD